MKKVSVIIEKALDGGFSCYTEQEFENFALAGYGDSVEEAKDDLVKSYEEIKEMEMEEGRQVPALTFEFRYDIQAFFNYFSFLNVSKVAERAGINPSLMRQYTSGVCKAGQKQYDKLSNTVKEMAKELSLATF